MTTEKKKKDDATVRVWPTTNQSAPGGAEDTTPDKDGAWTVPAEIVEELVASHGYTVIDPKAPVVAAPPAPRAPTAEEREAAKAAAAKAVKAAKDKE